MSTATSSSTLAVEAGQENHRTGTIEKFEIGHGIVIDGPVTAPGSSILIIHGAVNGSIKSRGAVEIGKTGEVVGSIFAEDLRIDGRVSQKGPGDSVSVSGHLAVGDSGHLAAGTVTYGSIAIARGACVSGLLRRVDASLDGMKSGESARASLDAPSDVAPTVVTALRFSVKKPAVISDSAPSSDASPDSRPDSRPSAPAALHDRASSDDSNAEKLEAPLPQRETEATIPQFLVLRPQSSSHSASSPVTGSFDALISADEDVHHG